MKTKPILFSGPMVRAILEGRKTQTRRIIKPQPDKIYEDGRPYWNIGGIRWPKCPYGEAGDLLWVRENWHTLQKWDDIKPSLMANDIDKIDYQADGYKRNPFWAWGKIRPSIFMPRAFNRITLAVTNIRVERLQAISESDAQAEGVHKVKIKNWNDVYIAGNHPPGMVDIEQPNSSDPIHTFMELWQSINGPDSWDTNPWLWVVDFEPHICNVDEYIKKEANYERGGGKEKHKRRI